MIDTRVKRSEGIAVDHAYFWNSDMSSCPKGVKVQLLNEGNVAVYGHVTSTNESLWNGWAPLPKIKRGNKRMETKIETKALQQPSQKTTERLWKAATIFLGLALLILSGGFIYAMVAPTPLPNMRPEALSGLIGVIVGWFTNEFKARIS